MKRLISLCCALILFSSVNAQYPQQKAVKSSKEPWRYGIKAGGSYDYLSIERGGEAKLGYRIGLVGEKRLVYNIFFQPSLNFIQKGFKYEIEKGYRLDVSAMFLEFEAGLLFKFGDDRLQRGFFLSLTPFYNYGIAGTQLHTDLNPKSPNLNKETEYKMFENNSRTDLGFRLGIGYDFNKHFEIGAGYTFGMFNYSNTSNYRWRGYNVQLLLFL